jgi:hypothetical protein
MSSPQMTPIDPKSGTPPTGYAGQEAGTGRDLNRIASRRAAGPGGAARARAGAAAALNALVDGEPGSPRGGGHGDGLHRAFPFAFSTMRARVGVDPAAAEGDERQRSQQHAIRADVAAEHPRDQPAEEQRHGAEEPDVAAAGGDDARLGELRRDPRGNLLHPGVALEEDRRVRVEPAHEKDRAGERRPDGRDQQQHREGQQQPVQPTGQRPRLARREEMLNRAERADRAAEHAAAGERRHQGDQEDHEFGAADQRRPVEVYAPSPRPYPERLPEPAYPTHDDVVPVGAKGAIRLRRHRPLYLSQALAGQLVGIREEIDGRWLVSFLDLDLGHVELDNRFTPLPPEDSVSPMSPV